MKGSHNRRIEEDAANQSGSTRQDHKQKVQKRMQFIKLDYSTQHKWGECYYIRIICIKCIIGPSVLRAPAEQTKVATILGIFLLVTAVIQNHRRGCRRFSNLCILKVTLQKRVPENFRSFRWGAERRV